MESVLAGSVGTQGRNHSKDVKLVQMLLNDWLGRRRQPLLKVDGLAGPRTNGAIIQFQTQNHLVTDGRVDPGGPSLKALIALHLAGVQAGLVQSAVARSATSPSPLRPALSNETLTSAAEAYLKKLRDGL